MKESPIIFSTPMVQAILEGRKTQTRRIIKPQPVKEDWLFEWKGTRPKAKRDSRALASSSLEGLLKWMKYAKYNINDVLWVRETFTIDSRGADGDNPGYYYKADMPIYEDGYEIWPDSWKPSIFMPKDYARIWLQITDVKVERLKDISVDDSISEGIEIDSETPIGTLYKDYFQKKWKDVYANPQNSFKSLWRDINGKDSWDANPWVWAITFKVLSTTGKPITV
jgi:hypothetical protein